MTNLSPIAAEIPRDRYGRPMVLPQGGGKPVAYTRATTYIDCLEDKFNLNLWSQRMVALGLASRPDLLLSVHAHKDDKKALNRIVDDAREAAGASAKATDGTSLHALTEVIDRGGELPVGLPANVKASLDAYAAATTDLKFTHIEQFCVLDTLKIGGTPDRIGPKIIDLKTGSIEWGALKIAMQLAVYARSWVYDIATGERTPHGADITEGIVVHLPAVDDPADARCDLFAVNLEAGWEALKVATQVREKRKIKFADLMHPLDTPRPAAPVDPRADRTLTQILANPGGRTVAEQIRACTTADEVRALWTPEWTDDLNEVARAHITSLPAAS